MATEDDDPDTAVTAFLASWTAANGAPESRYVEDLDETCRPVSITPLVAPAPATTLAPAPAATLASAR